MIVFYSVVVKLKASKDGVYDFYPGQKIHSLFLGLIRKTDETLAKNLHNEQKEKSFTVSSFLGTNYEKPIAIRSQNYYFIRLTILDEEVFNAMIASLLEKNAIKEPMKIGNIYYEIEEVLFDQSKSKWASHTSAEELFSKDYTENLIKLRFHTPTLFKAGDSFCRFPIPQKVFNSLLKKFNRYSESHKIDQAVEPKFNHITIFEKKTQSRRITLRDFYIEGFIGDVTFKVPEDDKELVKIANVLGDFSLYAGVGYKTTMGLGQVERIPLQG
ncbi:CRISPR-associated endoribonuclease Cas6 [Pseudothermotoga sp. U03pept]|uniref:CRISPR-associated endoribonuclease Cas6 n=1 Tax=Pseudothermotoga sp. U03pept TaxID=3447012 RepID=UPI003F09F9DD